MTDNVYNVLPLASLDKLAMSSKLEEIGQSEGASTKAGEVQ